MSLHRYPTLFLSDLGGAQVLKHEEPQLGRCVEEQELEARRRYGWRQISFPRNGSVYSPPLNPSHKVERMTCLTELFNYTMKVELSLIDIVANSDPPGVLFRSPTPLICHKTQQNLAPVYFYFPFIIVSLTPFIVFVRLAYHVHLAYSQPLRSLSGGE